MKKFFSTQPIWYNEGLFLIRIILGFFMAYHGWEVFNEKMMSEYSVRDEFKSLSSPLFMVYLGKASELAGGILMLLGLFTRLAAILIAGTMAYIAFFAGNGIIWYNDQHPFLFVLLALVFFFTGPGTYSLDARLFKK